MAKIRDTAALVTKFTTRAAAASGDYKTGVMASGPDWQTNALAGKDNFAAGVQQAIADDRFSKGIQKSGSAYYVEKASTLGAQRFGPGVQAAGNVWAEGAQPYLEAAKQPPSTPRRPKGDPGNMARANEMAARFRAIKVGR